MSQPPSHIVGAMLWLLLWQPGYLISQPLSFMERESSACPKLWVVFTPQPMPHTFLHFHRCNKSQVARFMASDERTPSVTSSLYPLRGSL